METKTVALHKLLEILKELLNKEKIDLELFFEICNLLFEIIV